jgi:hypothetical protein
MLRIACLLVFIAFVLTAPACKKHDDPLPNGVHARINGGKWAATSVGISHSSVPTAHGSIGFTTIRAVDSLSGEKLDLSVANLVKPGSYSLAPTIAQAYYFYNGNPIYLTGGVINVTSLSSTNIQGTFECANDFGNVIAITDGTFNVPVQ